MIPLGPLRLLPQVRATQENGKRETRRLNKIYRLIKIMLTDCTIASYLKKRKDRKGVWSVAEKRADYLRPQGSIKQTVVQDDPYFKIFTHVRQTTLKNGCLLLLMLFHCSNSIGHTTFMQLSLLLGYHN